MQRWRIALSPVLTCDTSDPSGVTDVSLCAGELLHLLSILMSTPHAAVSLGASLILSVFQTKLAFFSTKFSTCQLCINRCEYAYCVLSSFCSVAARLVRSTQLTWRSVHLRF